MNLSKKFTQPKISKLASCVKAGLFATSSLVCMQVSAETYDLDFSIQGLNTFGNTNLKGIGDLKFIDFNKAFNFGGLKEIKIPPFGPNLGTYGFKAGAYANADAGFRYAYNLGQHSYNLSLPISIDLNVSEIDAQNRITVSSSYSLGSNAGIAPTVDTSNAFLKLDPYLKVDAGINAKACLSKCTNLIDKSINIDTHGGDPNKYLIDVHAEDLNVAIVASTSKTSIGEQLTKHANLFGINHDESVNKAIGEKARDAGLGSLIAHIPGDEFVLTSEGTRQSSRDNSFSLSATGRDEFFQLGVDLIDLTANKFKKFGGDKIAKVLKGDFGTEVAGIDFQAGWDLLDIDVTATAFMDQNFNFSATPTIDLMLSNNQMFTMDAGQELVIQLDNNTDFIDLTPTFNLGGRFSSTFDLGFGLGVNLDTLGYNFDLPIGNIPLKAGLKVKDFGIGNVDISRDPINVSEEREVDIQVASTRRNVNQLGSVQGATLTTALPSVNAQGTSGKDILEGTHGPDTLSGLAGNDTLVGSAGDDMLDGGAGTDTVSYIGTNQAVWVSLGLGQQNTRGGPLHQDTLVNIENVTGSKYDDYLLGDQNNNVLNGANGNDRLVGSTGDDILIGGAGNDTISGGVGNDTADYRTQRGEGKGHLNTGAQGIEVDLHVALERTDLFGAVISYIAGVATGPNGERDTLNGIENVSGSDLRDTLSGDGGDNILKGRSGMDKLYGREGNDELYGGNENDVLYGGNGDDYLRGGKGADQVYGEAGDDTFYQTMFELSTDDFDGGEGNDTLKLDGRVGFYVDLADGEAYRRDKTAVRNTITNIENVSGGDGNDIIFGDGNDNVINGGLGYDQLRGRDGNDTFIYSAGNDTYLGGADTDTLDASEHSSRINVVLSSAQYDLENVIGTRFDDTIMGDEKHNRLDGGAGNNYLSGANGHDIFVVHNGKNEANATNILNGGNGTDTVLLTQQVKESDFVARYQNGDLVLSLNKGHQVVLEQQYQNIANRTERLNNAGAGIKNIDGSYEQLVNRRSFQQYQIDSDFTTQQNLTNHTRLTSNAKLTNNHTLTNNGTFHSDGALVNNGKLVNRGSLIVSSLFDNNGELRNGPDGVIQFLADNRLNGNIVNNGLISVGLGNWLQISGEYAGSGHFNGNVAFDSLTLNIGNSPGDTTIQGNASFSDVDFNLEVGLDSFGNIVYDTFNVLGDFTLAGGMKIGVSLLDSLVFDDVFGIDFNFINVTGDVFDGAGELLTIDDLLAYSYEVADNVFARWNYFDDLGYTLSFSGTDLFLANGGVLPPPSDVPAPKTLSLLLLSMMVMLWRRKNKLSQLH